MDAARLAKWKSSISTIVPTECYSIYARSVEDNCNNWALFTAVSEYFRKSAGLGGEDDFIDLQLAQQLRWFDGNGMYMDRRASDVYQPIMYDIVPRGLLAMLLNRGYRGKHYEKIDEILRKSALFTLKMQSPNGEIAFGGRSNQFIHNEPFVSVIYEYEAKRYKNNGNTALAEKFKSAVDRALSVTEAWLDKQPMTHIKNRFDKQTKYGCEKYAYFDKYMITVASNLCAAYLISDGQTVTAPVSDTESTVWQSSEHFHKLFVKSGGYGLEFDLNGHCEYDASGLGRVHRVGAPSTIALSCPSPAEPNYAVNIPPVALSFCSAIRKEGEWKLNTWLDSEYRVLETEEARDCASATIECSVEGRKITESYTVSKNGVEITVLGDTEIGYALPAFYFDGEFYTKIKSDGNSVTIEYNGWVCRYTTDGCISETDILSPNRNGYYKAFLASGKEKLRISIGIVEAK